MSAIESRTTNYRLRTINFNWATWHDEMNANLRDIDAIIATLSGIRDTGVWENATAYVIGDRRIDEDYLKIYQCAVNHTSHASNTFEQDRIDHPTYWAEVIESSVVGGVNFQFIYDSSTTTGADPGTGNFRLNNATLASATAITFSASSKDSGNPDISDFIASFDDMGDTANRGYLTLRKEGDPAFFRTYVVSGTVTDSTTHLTLTIANTAGAGTLSANDTVYFQFIPTGATGATGEGAALWGGRKTANFTMLANRRYVVDCFGGDITVSPDATWSAGDESRLQKIGTGGKMTISGTAGPKLNGSTTDLEVAASVTGLVMCIYDNTTNGLCTAGAAT